MNIINLLLPATETKPLPTETKSSPTEIIFPAATIISPPVKTIKPPSPYFNIPNGYSYQIKKKKSSEKIITVLENKDLLLKSTALLEMLTVNNLPHLYNPISIVTALKKPNSNLYSLDYFCCCLVTTPSGKTLNDGIKIYLKNQWSGTDFTPEFLIDYSLKPESESESELEIFYVNFQLDLPVCPKQVTTYLWQDDPVGSRGTVTTVKDPTSVS